MLLARNRLCLNWVKSINFIQIKFHVGSNTFWKKLSNVKQSKQDKVPREHPEKKELYTKIGQLQIEVDFLKKSCHNTQRRKVYNVCLTWKSQYSKAMWATLLISNKVLLQTTNWEFGKLTYYEVNGRAIPNNSILWLPSGCTNLWKRRVQYGLSIKKGRKAI